MITPRILPLLFAATLASSYGSLVNVNFNGFTGNPKNSEIESTLSGPAGGLGTSWNQYAAKNSTGTLVDSTNVPSTITFTTTFTEGRPGTATDLPIFRSTLTDFGKGILNQNLTISELAVNGIYDIWILAYRDNAGAAERLSATWSTTNSSVSPSSQLIDSTGTRNGATFVAGFNYALFNSVQANGSGTIVFRADATATFRSGLSGFQIAPAAPIVPPEPLEITSITRKQDPDEVTLTWKSNPGEKYGLYWSDHLDSFTMDGAHHAIPADASANRTTLGPIPNPRPGATKLFFRVGPPDLSNPTLAQISGSGNTVTLGFSEPIHPDSVAALNNFSVVLNGVPLTVLAATLDASGKSITLTLSSSLAVGTAYSVAAQNISTLAGRVVPTTFSGNFQTWDNNPNGVKIFILAGQSNMVGHGKAEQGVGDVNGAIGSLRYLAVNDTANYGQLLVDPAHPATSAWKSRSDVKVWWRDSDIGATRAVIKGDLKLGYSEGRNSTWFGPEYAFGWVMGDYYTQPVLIIKTAWGGKSLNVDFRPPSAVAARGGVVGPYYTGMVGYVRDCLTHLDTEFPEFAGMGYQIAGFGWHQGYNDRIDSTNSANYKANLVDLIHDLRAEFSRPNLPFSIGTTGMDITGPFSLVEQAQLDVANPSLYPEFSGNVMTDNTRPYWRNSSVSPSNFGYHWNHNGESHYLVGKGMGVNMQNLLTH